LLDGLRALGLVSAPAVDVEAAIKVKFPHGTERKGEGEVLRPVFLHLNSRH
jgi:hypothetical protein